ncbi:DUF2267 domain-containing protein [Streptomyces griseoluteus]|uniref:DUF2267 domain-containing protein n=1 Tax=Streptomyces griseoluteus TaxID=29306 RepID=UPI00342023F8
MTCSSSPTIHTLFSIGVASASGPARTPVVTTHSTRAVTTAPPGARGRARPPAPWGSLPAVPWNSPFPDEALYPVDRAGHPAATGRPFPTREEIAKGYGANLFVRRVADRAEVPRELVEAGIPAVLAPLREAVGDQEFRDATAQLPREYDILLSTPAGPGGAG